MVGDEAFLTDLQRWVHRFYSQRELLAAKQSRTAAEQLFDRERNLLTWLSAQLMLSIAMLPWLGVWGVVVALAILYLGTLISGAWILQKERRLTRRKPPRSIETEAERAYAACPPLDADARALLTRLMNLTELRPTPRSLEAMRGELRDTLAVFPLSQWSFLHELATVLDTPDGVRLGTLKPQLAE